MEKDEKKSPQDASSTGSAGNKTANNADAEVNKGSGTQTENTSEGSIKKTPAVVVDDDEDDEIDLSETGDDDQQETVVQMTQTQLNDLINKRVRRVRDKLGKRVEKLEALVNTVTVERDNYKTTEVQRVKSELDALPDSIREMLPDSADKLNEDKVFKRIVDWLPKAKKLADQMQVKTEDKPAEKPKTPTTGNLPDPPGIAATKKANQSTELHPVWRYGL